MTPHRHPRRRRLHLNNGHSSLLGGQNLYLRLLILLFALISTLEASLLQLVSTSILFLLFMLLDLSLFTKLLRGLRISLAWLAGYWLFATLFGTDFPVMALFSLRVFVFITVTVYTLGNLSLDQILRDTQSLRKHRIGEKLVHYCIATGIYIRLYAKHFVRHKPKLGSSLGDLMESMIFAGAQVYKSTSTVENQLRKAVEHDSFPASNFSANMVALCLMALLVLLNSL